MQMVRPEARAKKRGIGMWVKGKLENFVDRTPQSLSSTVDQSVAQTPSIQDFAEPSGKAKEKVVPQDKAEVSDLQRVSSISFDACEMSILTLVLLSQKVCDVIF